MDAPFQVLAILRFITFAQGRQRLSRLKAWVMDHRQAAAKRGADAPIVRRGNQAVHLQLAFGDVRSRKQFRVQRLKISPAANKYFIRLPAVMARYYYGVFYPADGGVPME